MLSVLEEAEMSERPVPRCDLILSRVKRGRQQCAGKLLELVYDDCAISRAYMQDERATIPWQATALVHERPSRLVEWQKVSWENRRAISRSRLRSCAGVLCDHARAKNAAKREGCSKSWRWTTRVSFANEKEFDVLAWKTRY